MSRLHHPTVATSRQVGLALKALRVRTAHLSTGEKATQARVAELSMLSLHQLRRIEQGSIEPTFQQVDRVLAVLGADLTELERVMEAPIV
jgi:transcriptional regulator with XRE-family HTH domain